MEEVFDQYGSYILAVISCAVVVGAVAAIFGITTSNPSLLGIHTTQVNTGFGEWARTSGTGNGILGKLVCFWLNRVM